MTLPQALQRIEALEKDQSEASKKTSALETENQTLKAANESLTTKLQGAEKSAADAKAAAEKEAAALKQKSEDATKAKEVAENASKDIENKVAGQVAIEIAKLGHAPVAHEKEGDKSKMSVREKAEACTEAKLKKSGLI